MGNRVAKFEGEDSWVVYASATGACYERIFFDELSAWLYAQIYSYAQSTISRSSIEREREYDLGDEVIRFIRQSYGGEDNFSETPLYLDEVASVTAGTREGGRILAELLTAFLEWDRHSLVAPRQPQEAE